MTLRKGQKYDVDNFYYCVINEATNTTLCKFSSMNEALAYRKMLNIKVKICKTSKSNIQNKW